jgi:hypothetical protein
MPVESTSKSLPSRSVPLEVQDVVSTPVVERAATPSTESELPVPALVHVRTYDAKELLPRLENNEKELPTLKASVCGVTAVLEEDIVEETRPKVMMSWVESGVRDKSYNAPLEEIQAFDSEEYVTLLDRIRSESTLDEDDIGFLSMLRDCVCSGFESVSKVFAKL